MVTEEKLRHVGLFSPKKRLWKHLTITCSYHERRAEKMEPDSPQRCLMIEQAATDTLMTLVEFSLGTRKKKFHHDSCQTMERTGYRLSILGDRQIWSGQSTEHQSLKKGVWAGGG